LDHNLVAAKINIKLKKLHRTCQRQSWNLDKLKNDDFVAMEYRCNVDTALEEASLLMLASIWTTVRVTTTLF